MEVTMYRSTPHGIRFWKAEANYDAHCIEIEHGMLGGATQFQTEDVDVNQSGRSIEDQIDLRIQSRATKKRDIGYRDTIEAAKAVSGNNTLGFKRPMLAKRFDQLSKVEFDGAYLQMKYDGHRCMVTRTSTGLIAYSRNGRRITSIDHILEGIQIPVGATIDGELYHHGTPLQTITSWVKRKQASTNRLEYIVYDTVSKDQYRDRYLALKSYRLGINARMAPTDKHVAKEQIGALLDSAIAMGYEGLILRQPGYGYEIGKRSAGLVKIKMFADDEFKVIDIVESADGWAVLICEVSDGGERFGVSAPGSVQQKMIVLRNKSQFIGRYVTVKYANRTNRGVPFHPVAERWFESV